MNLAINKQTNEAFLVRNDKIFAQDYGIEQHPRPYTDKEVFTARSTGKFPNRSVWKFYNIPEVSLAFAEAMCPAVQYYTLMSRPWMTETVFKQFQELQKALKTQTHSSKHLVDKVEATKVNALAMIIELVELLQNLPHKSWRSINDQPFNESLALEELIDVFFFVFNISIAMNWTYVDLIIAMAYKMKVNFNRIEEGYNQID